MVYSANTDNMFIIEGNIARLNEYAGGKAMNVTVAVSSDKGSDVFVTVKTMSPTVFSQLTKGMRVRIHGHIGSASYKDKDGNIKYKDNNDLIADAIKINEIKAVSMARRFNDIIS